jgi:hypothetical protein
VNLLESDEISQVAVAASMHSSTVANARARPARELWMRPNDANTAQDILLPVAQTSVVE